MIDDVSFIANLILSGVSARSAEFLLDVVKAFGLDFDATCKEMAYCYGCTPQSARYHVYNLTVKGYLVRRHYRSWTLSPTSTELCNSIFRKDLKDEN